MRNSLAQTSGE